jgi:hypothetical protein
VLKVPDLQEPELKEKPVLSATEFQQFELEEKTVLSHNTAMYALLSENREQN